MEEDNGIPGARGRARGAVIVLAFAAMAIALGFVLYAGIRARTTADARLTRSASEAAVPTVAVVYPKIGAPIEEIILPGNAQAFTDSPIYARTSGYLKRWYSDIGARVTQGQLLAEIDTPEVDKQVLQARADLATVDANLSLAKITADRQQLLFKDNATAKQNVDQAVSNLAALQATYNSSTANLHRLEDIQSFQKVYAPFAGVVTARNTDIGALISAGTANVAAKELFHVSAIETLRVYVAVPEIFSRAARPGATASLTLEELPGRLFHGTLVRNANAIDPASRTLLAEVDVDNPDGQLLPGAYVRVRLELSNESPFVTIPANALLFRREGLRVGVVRNDTAELVPVTIGRDYGSTVEIVSGLQSTDAVIVDPSDSLISGTPVRTKTGSTGQ